MLYKLQRKTLIPSQIVGYALTLLVGMSVVMLAVQAFVDLKPLLTQQTDVFKAHTVTVSKNVTLFKTANKEGIYFKKRIIIDGQGNTSIYHEKKNFAVDFCEDEWIGEKTTDIRIGNWVTQDGFHFKAFHTSITKGECPVSYKLYDKFRSTKPLNRQYPYLDYYSDDEITAAMSLDESERSDEFRARCYPDGFPCIVYLNGDYYGIYSWQLKKHRDNYNMGRNKENNIHLDGN